MADNLKKLLKYSHTLKILFAEDNNDVRVQLLKLFENFFTNIDVEIDGLDALERFDKYNVETGTFYDLVITDLSMPRLDGVDFCKKIIERNPNQVILVISAHTESKKIIELLDVGIYKFLQKPVDYKELLNTLSSTISKIKREKSYLQLEQEVTNIDKLTSTYNRKYIENILIDKFKQLEENTNNEFSIILIDIDNFGQVNDKYNSQTCDEILKDFALILKSNFNGEVIGRWAGEEFILIYDKDINKSYSFAEKIRKEIEETNFKNIEKLTASFGVASYEKGDTLLTLIQKADFSLYRAKKEGKNKVSINES